MRLSRKWWDITWANSPSHSMFVLEKLPRIYLTSLQQARQARSSWYWCYTLISFHSAKVTTIAMGLVHGYGFAINYVLRLFKNESIYTILNPVSITCPIQIVWCVDECQVVGTRLRRSYGPLRVDMRLWSNCCSRRAKIDMPSSISLHSTPWGLIIITV